MWQYANNCTDITEDHFLKPFVHKFSSFFYDKDGVAGKLIHAEVLPLTKVGL